VPITRDSMGSSAWLSERSRSGGGGYSFPRKELREHPGVHRDSAKDTQPELLPQIITVAQKSKEENGNEGAGRSNQAKSRSPWGTARDG